MKLGNLLILLVSVLILSSCTGTDPVVNTQKIEKLCRKIVTDKNAVGVSYSIEVDTLIPINDRFGFTNYEDKSPLNKGSKFRIASTTKPITATSILQLVEANRISLDDNLTKFFPNYPDGDKINIYQLLSHTSGIPNWYEANMPKDTPSNFPMCRQPHIYIQKMKKNLLFEPGTFFSYSNTGYVLLGEIIEIVSSMKYEDYIKENIFEPIGMKNTELEYIENPQDNWVQGYVKKEDNAFSSPDTYHMPFSAGGLRSTSEDLLLFLNALENETILGREIYQKMISYAQLKNGNPVHTSLYAPNGEKFSFPSNIDKFGYGLGFQIIENFGKKVISHGGDIAGFNSILIYIPHNDVKIIILANTENGIMSKLREIEKLATAIQK